MKQTFKNEMRELMVKSWSYVKRYGYTISEAMKVAWMNLKLRKAMKTRIVKFFYIKKGDNSLRQAFGTTDPTRYDYEAKGGRNGNYEDCVQYYDVEKKSFRMFKDYNLLKVVL